MKKNMITQVAIVATILISTKVFSQGFVNLDFEHPILPLAPVFNEVPANRAIPGWTAYYSTSTTTNQAGVIWYNTVSLGGAFIALCDTNANSLGPPPIQGAYSLLLEGSTSGTPRAASIGQTGQIPANALSLIFWGYPYSATVSFASQTLSLVMLGSTPSYNIYGADISAFAGQTGQLLFTAQPFDFCIIDNIQFSSSPIPEPSTLALGALGTVLLGFRRWQNSSR